MHHFKKLELNVIDTNGKSENDFQVMQIMRLEGAT